ncbi:MAG: hypothetical protein LBC95_02865 [Candidatus Nomurabacteria bacterium]|jgi:hypothetical protein|nr:hypothetical protein [Candidatus Nomurabacteria bacterium]
MKKGTKTIPNGVIPEQHEIKTADFFTNQGENVEFIKSSATRKMPDIKMAGRRWEMKSPKGKGRENLEHTFRAAIKQSENIIIDLRRSKIPEKKAIIKLEREFNMSKRAKHLIIITKCAKRLDFPK